MSAEENKAIVRRFFDEAVNRQSTNALDELMSPEMQSNFAPPGSGREGFKQGMLTLFAAFPDLKVNLEAMLAEGDEVATRGTITGTHQGEFQGIPPTGKQVTFPYSEAQTISLDLSGKQARVLFSSQARDDQPLSPDWLTLAPFEILLAELV